MGTVPLKAPSSARITSTVLKVEERNELQKTDQHLSRADIDHSRAHRLCKDRKHRKALGRGKAIR